MTLLHLVSEQTMQNLLPLLALRPARVIQLVSNGEKYEAAARHIEDAAREADIDATFQPYRLESAFPDVAVTRQALKQLLSVFPEAVVNVTGGTKLMCIGAFLGTGEFPVPMLYCDTDRQEFIPLGKYPLPGMPSFAETARQLTVRVVMAAHGKAPSAWRFDTADPAALEFGRKAFDLRWRRRHEFRACDFSRCLRNFFRADRGKVPSDPGRLNALCRADLCEALPDPVPPVALDFLEAARAAQFVEATAGGGFQLAPPKPNHPLRDHVEKLVNLLDGSWFELTVLDLVRRSAEFADPHWSVEPLRSAAHEEAQSFGETDVVCLGLPQGNLQVISCKTSLEKPLEHLEALRERSHNLGGRYAKAALAVLFARREQEEELRRWGRLLGVEILIGDETLRRFGSPRTSTNA
jgi:hypothetical protein